MDRERLQAKSALAQGTLTAEALAQACLLRREQIVPLNAYIAAIYLSLTLSVLCMIYYIRLFIPSRCMQFHHACACRGGAAPSARL